MADHLITIRRIRRIRLTINAIGLILFAADEVQAIPVAVIAGVLGVAATSFVAIAVSAIVNLGLSLLVSKLVTPKQRAAQQDRQATVTTVQIGEVPRMAIFGTAATAGSLLDAFNYGGQYGTDWEVAVFALADHRCNGLLGYYASDTYHDFAGDGDQPDFAGQLAIWWTPGTLTQAAPSILATQGGWAADDNVAGVSFVVVAYKADAPNASNPVWASGRPSFLWVVKGAYCYQARKDSTVLGGSGPHRWDDPDTWEYSENPIDCRYNWVRGIYAGDQNDRPDMLLVGRGLSATEAPPENVAAYANICDELVPSTGSATEPRYRIGGVVSAGDEYITTEEMFAAACAGIIIQPQGSVEIEPGHAKSSVLTITDDDILTGEACTYSQFRSESDAAWLNTVVPRYVEPTQKWADHGAPIRRVYADVIADGKPREESLSLPMVPFGLQAQRCGEIARRLGRLTVTSTNALGPRFAAIEDGDWITWVSARRFGGQARTFRVEAYGLSKEWRNTLQLREIASTCYGWTADDGLSDGAVAEQPVAPPPTAYITTRAAYRFVTQTVAYPLGSDDDTVTIAAFSGVLDDGRSIDLAAGAVDGLDPGTLYGIFYRLADGAYLAVPAPASVEMASADYAFINFQSTSDSGVFPPEITPPGGYGGTGPCLIESEPLLLANNDRTGPGATIALGEARAGMWVWTRHHATREAGAYQITRATRVWQPLLRAGGRPVGTASHLFGIRGGWLSLGAIGAPCGEGWVVKLTVEGAETYQTLWEGEPMLHHNKRDTSGE